MRFCWVKTRFCECKSEKELAGLSSECRIHGVNSIPVNNELMVFMVSAGSPSLYYLLALSPTHGGVATALPKPTTS